MKKSRKLATIWSCAILGVIVGASVPTAVVWGLKNKKNIDINFSSINSKKYLDSLINDQNVLNEFLVSQGVTDNTNNIINSSASVTGVDQNGNIVVKIDVTLSPDNALSFTGSTQVKAVFIDENALRSYVNTINDSSKMTPPNLDKTISDSNSLFLSSSNYESSGNKLDSSCLAQNTSVATNSGKWNENLIDYWIYDINIVLNDSYAFIDASNNLSSEKSILNVKSHVVSPYTIDLDRLHQLILENSNNLDEFNNLLNSSNLKDLISNPTNGVVESENAIKSVSNPSYKINSTNGEITINFEITMNDDGIINVSAPTTLKAIICNDNTFRTYYKNNVNSEEIINNVDTVYSSNSLNINNSLQSVSSVKKPSYVVENNLPFIAYDFTLNANNGYVFSEDGLTVSGLSHVVNDVITNILYSGGNIIIPEGPDQNDSNLDDIIGNITNPDDANNIVTNPGDIIDQLPEDIVSIIDKKLSSATLTDVNSEGAHTGKLHINLNYVFTNGETQSVNYITNINIVRFNNENIINAIKQNVNNSTDLLNLNEILINSQAAVDVAPFSKIDDNSLQIANASKLDTTANNDLINKNCYNINLLANLKSQGYCFFDPSTDTLARINHDFGQYLSQIIQDYNVSLNNENLFNIINQYVSENFKDADWALEDTKTQVLEKLNSIFNSIDSEITINDINLSINNYKGQISIEINKPSYINIISESDNISVSGTSIIISNLDFMKNNYEFRANDFYIAMSNVSKDYLSNDWNSDINNVIITSANKFIANSNINIDSVVQINTNDVNTGNVKLHYEIIDPNIILVSTNDSPNVIVNTDEQTIEIQNLPLKQQTFNINFMDIYDIVEQISLKTADDNWTTPLLSANSDLINQINNVLSSSGTTVNTIEVGVDETGNRYLNFTIDNPNNVLLIDISAAGTYVTYSDNTFHIVNLDK